MVVAVVPRRPATMTIGAVAAVAVVRRPMMMAGVTRMTHGELHQVPMAAVVVVDAEVAAAALVVAAAGEEEEEVEAVNVQTGFVQYQAVAKPISATDRSASSAASQRAMPSIFRLVS